MDTIYLAGGCFWGVEELFRNLDGILKTEVGYTGGETKNPTYETVKMGTTGHAESLKVEFDPKKITRSEVFEFFFSIHDPTTLDRQGNDKGSQYRSAIFLQSEIEREEAQRAIDKAQSHWQAPIVTSLEPFTEFYSAEGYHQDYLQKNPNGYTCHWKRY